VIENLFAELLLARRGELATADPETAVHVAFRAAFSAVMWELMFSRDAGFTTEISARCSSLSCSPCAAPTCWAPPHPDLGAPRDHLRAHSGRPRPATAAFAAEPRYLGYREPERALPFAHFFRDEVRPVQEHVRDALLGGKAPSEFATTSATPPACSPAPATTG